MNEYNYSLGPNLYNHLYFVKIGADTLINGIHYRKAIQTSDTILLDWVTFGFIRETVEKKSILKDLAGRRD